MGLNKPVEFSIAKLLKEKGFDINTGTAFKYTLENGHIEDEYIDVLSWNDVSGVILAPTIAEVVMWLYEKHGVWITVDININGKFNYLLRQFNSKDRAWEVKNSISISEYFNSPTEAYQAALEYCLTELI